ncbi:golgin subfamily B member 1 isoform X2 [Corythoichthys intestinalis]|uniref:golgin subfamily B member 1 isoform X2 n=1 Tax=Corythoichthys intestinalis TaxID=161448 RepID=UPI0025A58809|nr:golgin subfamily B member 1 isoform X2 [Corythoichthys intestinalis]XP_061809699.1 golgin subfamily B member 1-like [Nerophis lumbriciformis]
MFSRLATVLQELSGEEGQDGETQAGELTHQLPAEVVQAPADAEAPEEAMERLAHLEQLVVQLKELIRDKDTQLASKDALLKNERETSEARFSKLKLQAKAKITSLSKQIDNLKVQEGTTSLDNSFSKDVAAEDDLQELQNKLREEEANSTELRAQLRAAEELLKEKEAAHNEQLKLLQAVVQDKDVRFQQQIQKHEEELQSATTQTSKDVELQQALHDAQRRCEELEEALKSRSKVLEMLQQEVISADQQKQILTAEFRKMEGELAEALKQKQEWAQRASDAAAALQDALERAKEEAARHASDLSSLSEAASVNLEREKTEVARLEKEMELMTKSVQACREGSERDKLEISRLEKELASSREAESDVVKASRSDLEETKVEVDKLENELASFRQAAQKKNEVLAEIWRHLQPLTLVQPLDDVMIPEDLSIILDTVLSIETQVTKLKDDQRESEECCAELRNDIKALQEQLDTSTSEKEEAIAKAQQLEQQIKPLSEGDSVEPQTDASHEADRATLMLLKQQLSEKDNELSVLQERLRVAEQSAGGVASAQNVDQPPGQVEVDDSGDNSATPPDSLEDTQEEETTLVAEDSSIFSISAGNESSPELLEHQESPEESKGTSSDEMVTSTDSEVAHSSWTLLEAVNQDGRQDWPSVVQDFGQLQSWEQETSTISATSSSLIIHENVSLHVTQEDSSTENAPSGVFAQAIAEELQKRYGELLAELQALREAAAESRKKIGSLEEEMQKLIAEKEEVEAQARDFEEELKSAREELQSLTQHNSFEAEKWSAEMRLLEEQIEILSIDRKAKEQDIQALQADMQMARQAISKHESQALMLSAQLDDSALQSSQLERKLQDMENSMLEQLQISALDSDSLSKKDSEISELQRRLNQKEQEMTELDESMSAKLSEAAEERVLVNSEVDKLKAQLVELKQLREESPAPEDEELASLRSSKEELETQLVSTRKKLQVVLVQRKELMKKVAEMEMEAKNNEEKDTAQSETPPEVQKASLEEMEVKLAELEQTLRSKDEAIETLQCKMIQQEQLLSETLAQSKDNETEQTDVESDNSLLRSQVASLETECETLQKKVTEAQESRKESIRKAKEKDRHHRDQLKQQKDEYSELLERFDLQSGERDALHTKVKELEEKMSRQEEELPPRENKNLVENIEKIPAKDWVQEDWVDFAASETDSEQTRSVVEEEQLDKQSGDLPVQTEEPLKVLREEIQMMQVANLELENELQRTQTSLSQKEIELQEVRKEILALRENERQIDALSDEINDLREKHLQAESCAEALKAEMEAATVIASSQSAHSIAALQAEVEEFNLFLDNKNREITELSQQLGEQNSFILSIQDTVGHKDKLIASLEQELKAEQEKSKKLEVEVPQRQEEEESETKLQQLQRKLQAALISRKDLLKENKTLKEQLSSSETLIIELNQRMQVAQDELEKLKTERTRLIDEVDRMLLENQSLGSSCESLKLAMDAIASEKDACRREGELAKEEAANMCKEWEEKVHGMKDEYETLLRSYENVSDEAERSRLVLEAARQERQELASKVRAIETSKEEAEMQAEEARKEVELVKDKMRKFVKAKQQKILELEEETERLREGQEKAKTSEDEAQTTELNRLREEMQTLKVEFDTAVAERDTLKQQMEQLKDQFDQVQAQDLTGPMVTDVQQSEPVVTEAEMIESKDASEQSPDDYISSTSAQVVGSELSTDHDLLDNKLKAMEVALDSEKERWQEREAELNVRISSLEQDLNESNEKAILMASLEERLQEGKEQERCLIEEGSKREIQFKELLRNLESEKDKLEDRLMYQLAQLNGSIAGYQQEAADCQKQLSELQQELERLKRERGDLETEVRAQTDRASRLEEDAKQAQRQRAEAEAEMGKQRELEQQLRSAHRVKEGSQSRARQLEELLREKQLEVRQLQKDSIQYQERISELGVEAKALQLGHNELSKNLEQSQEKNSKNLEELKRTETELANCKSNLNETKEQLNQAILEKTTLEKNIGQKEALWKVEAEQNLDSVRFRLGAELKEMELRLEEAYSDRDKEEEATSVAREAAQAAERRTQEMQARLDESLARLAAFSRCMSSLQDDRDRVLDEARQWEARFNDALLGKEAEIRDAETRAKKLAENLQNECSLKEELQLSLERLEKNCKEQQLKLDEVEKNLNESRAEAERERAKLLQTTTELQSAQSEARLLKDEVEAHSQRSRALEEAVARLQEDIGGARAELQEREAEYRRLCLTLEQLEADLHTSKAWTEDLHVALHEKEKREVEMLDEKEQAVAQAAEDARTEAEGRARDAEEELEQRRGELRDVQEQLRKAEEVSDGRRTKLDSFTKAMGSLQDDRDRLLNTYKQLEEKHLQVMIDKDALIQEAASENNSLKEELRSLLIQRDDLYAEKAKLSAQLHGYRDELKQVLSMKDSQHKQLLATQRERIAYLEKERDDLEKALRNSAESETVKVEQMTPLQAGTIPGAEVEKLKEQLEAAREQARALEENLLKEREEHKSETKELSELRWEGGLMRTESESAQERVAELARDLLAVEQKLLEEKELAAQLRAENQSFGKAMASLQDSKDQAEHKARQLGLKLEELSKAGSPSTNTAGEVWSLKNALQALQNDRERLLDQLQAQTSHLKTQKSELARLGAGELIKVSQELFEEKNKNTQLASIIEEMENTAAQDKQEIETLRLEHIDYLAQAEQLKQQTLSALSERDQQLRQLTAMLEEARAHTPKRQKEHYNGEASQEVDSAPGAPQERSSLQEVRTSRTELLQLQQRLEEEMQQRLSAEEQLMEAQDRLRRQAKWEDHSETAVFIEPPEGSVTRTRRGTTGSFLRALRSGVCWRRRTPLLLGVYLLSVHVLLLLCVGGYL